MTKILLCDKMKNYGELLDEIFNVKFIERAMQLKAMVDCQIMAIHPHMARIIAYYDLLIYRYYSPVWNRNGEGKLQALEEEEEEEEDNDDKKELNTGGLEKGEGVQIVVLKVVPRKKKKNKKEKDEEENEKDEKEGKKDEKKKKKKMMGLKMEKKNTEEEK